MVRSDGCRPEVGVVNLPMAEAEQDLSRVGIDPPEGAGLDGSTNDGEGPRGWGG